MVSAVRVINPLQYFLAPLVLEVDVDIGRFAALLGDEALEQEVVAVRIDRGNAQNKADAAVGRRTSALAEDIFGPRELDDRVHRQKIGRVFQPLDKIQLMLQQADDLVRHTFRIAPLRALPHQTPQGLVG